MAIPMRARAGSSPAAKSVEPGDRPGRTSVFVWALPIAAIAIGIVGIGALVLALRETRQLEARLADLEAQDITGRSSERAAPPSFILDPASPSEHASVTTAVAALSSELADLRARLANQEGAGDDTPTRSIDELSRSENSKDRRRAVNRLRDKANQDPAARAALAKFLKDPDDRVRRDALNAIVKLHDENSINDIVGVLGDSDPRLRARATRAVGDLGRNAKDPAQRATAARALDGLLADGQTGIRRQATEALGRLGGPEVTPALVRAMSDKNFEVQEQAVEAAGRNKDPAALAGLRQAYGDGSGPNALEAAVSMKQLGDPSLYQKESARLKLVLQQGGSAEEKREALQLLVENSPEEAAAILDKALRDPSEGLRREAQRLLEKRQGR
jgi:HEAT repeat protein